jgi:hypothetical protein
LENFIAGGFGGAAGIIFGVPGEIIKVRMINDLYGKKYRGF